MTFWFKVLQTSECLLYVMFMVFQPQLHEEPLLPETLVPDLKLVSQVTKNPHLCEREK